MEIHTLALTAAADGTDQADTRAVNGRVLAVFHRPTDLGAGTTLTVTTVVTEQTILDGVAAGATDKDYFPVTPVHDSDGDPIPATYVHRPAVGEAVRVAIAGAAESETGNVLVITE